MCLSVGLLRDITSSGVGRASSLFEVKPSGGRSTPWNVHDQECASRWTHETNFLHLQMYLLYVASHSGLTSPGSRLLLCFSMWSSSRVGAIRASQVGIGHFKPAPVACGAGGCVAWVLPDSWLRSLMVRPAMDCVRLVESPVPGLHEEYDHGRRVPFHFLLSPRLVFHDTFHPSVARELIGTVSRRLFSHSTATNVSPPSLVRYASLGRMFAMWLGWMRKLQLRGCKPLEVTGMDGYNGGD